MSHSVVVIEMDADRRAYAPGDTMRATCLVEPPPVEEILGVEWSVFWRTEGKGDEDSETVATMDETAGEGGWLDVRRLKPLEVRLPASPLSYDGVMLKIRWFVHVRLRCQGGSESECELEFRLGSVPAVQELAT